MSKLQRCRLCGGEPTQYPDAECAGESAAVRWTRLMAPDPLPDSIQEALNSGDGVYRP